MGIICHNGWVSAWWSESVSGPNTDREPNPVSIKRWCNGAAGTVSQLTGEMIEKAQVVNWASWTSFIELVHEEENMRGKRERVVRSNRIGEYNKRKTKVWDEVGVLNKYDMDRSRRVGLDTLAWERKVVRERNICGNFLNTLVLFSIFQHLSTSTTVAAGCLCSDIPLSQTSTKRVSEAKLRKKIRVLNLCFTKSGVLQFEILVLSRHTL